MLLIAFFLLFLGIVISSGRFGFKVPSFPKTETLLPSGEKVRVTTEESVIIDAVDKDYLYYALSSDSAQSQFQAQALGGVVKNLNIDRAKGVTIAVPPLAEQQKLVADVRVIEQTIAQAQATIAAAPAKKQAVMQRYL